MQKLVLIGASTGGPGHIKKLLAGISLGDAIILIAQHMNKLFLPSFASQLGRETGLKSILLDDVSALENGNIYVCDKNFELYGSLAIMAKPNMIDDTTYSPNVDMLFLSALPFASRIRVMSILLTGIGDDGAKGLSELQKAGAKCLAESEDSAIVYGMPKRAVELNSNIKSLPLMGIKKELEEFLNVF